MTDLEKAARMALEALGYYEVAGLATTRVAKSITALRQVLSDSVEQPAQQQKEGFASPGGGYVPAIPRPMPLDWKLVPRKATPEMLKAMDECAQEGYDERLYAGMASSVYMAAWDASPVMGTLPEQPAQQEHKPWCASLSALMFKPRPCDCKRVPLPPPQRKPWVGLTREEKQHIIDANFGGSRADCMDEAERILRRKNT